MFVPCIGPPSANPQDPSVTESIDGALSNLSLARMASMELQESIHEGQRTGFDAKLAVASPFGPRLCTNSHHCRD